MITIIYIKLNIQYSGTLVDDKFCNIESSTSTVRQQLYVSRVVFGIEVTSILTSQNNRVQI